MRRVIGILCAAVFAASCPAVAQTTPTRMTALSLSNPSAPGAAIPLHVHVDALGPGAPTGWVSFWDGATRIGDAKLPPATDAGQTLDGGYFHSCGLTSAGGVKCWGYNRAGQLGDGTSVKKLTPVNVVGLASGVIAVSAGYYHSCAVTHAGGVKCWGNNDHRQLGNGAATQFKPIDVTGLTSGAVAVSAGYFHSCALTAAGGVKCWGAGGALGDGTTVTRATPVDVSGLSSGVVALTAGDHHSCALTRAGGVKCWGYGHGGRLGDGTNAERRTPVDVVSLTSGVAAISAGAQHSCAVTRAGAAKCWGDNYYGQLGDGTTTTRLTPVDVYGLQKGVKAITAGYDYSCALTVDGRVTCLGNNGRAQLGFGPSGRRAFPVELVGLVSNATAITAAFDHTCATSDAGVQCWGRNDYGQLGDGTLTERHTPTATLNLSPLIRASVDFVTPPLAAGPHWLRAFYRGDATHATALGGVRQKIE